MGTSHMMQGSFCHSTVEMLMQDEHIWMKGLSPKEAEHWYSERIRGTIPYVAVNPEGVAECQKTKAVLR